MSYRSNSGTRFLTDATQTLADFYPTSIVYADSVVSTDTLIFKERQVHTFSWVNPNWAYTSIRHYGHDDAGTTVQDMRFSLVYGDTLETAAVFSGSGTQITLVLSP